VSPSSTLPVTVPQLVDPAIVAEHVVGLEAHLAEVLHALLVAGRRVDRRAGVLRQRDL